MTQDQAIANFNAATANFADAKRALADQRFLARNRMSNTLAFAEMREHTSYHAWLRAHAALENHAPASAHAAPRS